MKKKKPFTRTLELFVDGHSPEWLKLFSKRLSCLMTHSNAPLSQGAYTDRESLSEQARECQKNFDEV